MVNEEPANETLRAGRYAVIRVLGEGAQAATLEAVDKKHGRLVAIKRFRVRGAKSWKEVELAEREARVLASIQHPLLPRYVEHFEEGGELFLVTEKIEGENLLSLRKRGVRTTEAEVARFLRDAASALDYLHGLNPPVVHRDIKPSNVMRRPDGSYALIDFGSVRDRMKPEGGSTVVGTFGYMAPEQFQGRAMPGSDVYAAGATALSMLTGREPEDLPHKGLAIDVKAAVGSGVSPAMVSALSAMLEPDPDKRAVKIGPLLTKIGAAAAPPPRAAVAQARGARQERGSEGGQARGEGGSEGGGAGGEGGSARGGAGSEGGSEGGGAGREARGVVPGRDGPEFAVAGIVCGAARTDHGPARCDARAPRRHSGRIYTLIDCIWKKLA
jgi:tRNA A-37 threonylcarbamoyl transferase component Bud32